MKMKQEELKEFLEEKVALYNRASFVESDPIQVPHGFVLKEDIEIAAFLTAVIAWGNRKMIIRNSLKMMDLLGNSPYDFVMEASPKQVDHFVHRTFNLTDLRFFLASLRNMYKHHGGLEEIFSPFSDSPRLQEGIHHLKQVFFEIEHPARTSKHLPDPRRGSAAKRINMFLRWMVRRDGAGVDFGLWNSLSPSQLSCPLDVHSGRVARKLGLLQRRQNDAKALEELDNALRKLDHADPVKYDYALFGLGVFEGF